MAYSCNPCGESVYCSCKLRRSGPCAGVEQKGTWTGGYALRMAGSNELWEAVVWVAPQVATATIIYADQHHHDRWPMTSSNDGTIVLINDGTIMHDHSQGRR